MRPGRQGSLIQDMCFGSKVQTNMFRFMVYIIAVRPGGGMWDPGLIEAGQEGWIGWSKTAAAVSMLREGVEKADGTAQSAQVP